jgi:beta-glucosidase
MADLRALSLTAGLAALLAACSAPAADQTGEDVQVSEVQADEVVDPRLANDPVADPELWPVAVSPVGRDAEIEARIADLLSRMTVEEKVGQVIQADISAVTPDEARAYNLGSVLNGGNSGPGGDNYAPPQAWLDLADAFWEASTDTSDGGVGIPLLWGTDAVHGHNNIVGATLFPHNVGLGAANDRDLIREIGAVTAAEVRVTGQDWTFAPTLAVVRDDRWGRTYEGYSESPEIVASFAGAMVEGLQGTHGTDAFLGAQHVLATAKHFLGDGGTDRGVDQGDNRDNERDLALIHGAGYPPAIEAGVQTVMASFSSWHGIKMHGNGALLTDVLVDRMGFDGFVVGDWNGHGQVEGCTATDCAIAFNAGLDMFMAPDSWRELYASLLADVESGAISMERLDEAVGRILRVKLRMGLFDAGAPSQRPLAGQAELIGSPEHRDVARRAVRQSLVLLKNDDAVLPIAGTAHVLVAGTAADNIGQQAGGWTINWQGEGNENADFPGGQSIYAGLAEAILAQGGQAVLSPDGAYDTRPDVAIVVFGEEPYAEFQGDRADLDFADTEGLDLLRRFRTQGIPTVAVFLSGRPMWINPEYNAADAFVAAWLPGSEGGGVADVLIGDAEGGVRHDFTGRLSYSWPARPDQTPLNVGDADYAPLFAYGFGLDYASAATFDAPQLDETSLADTGSGSVLALITQGRAQGRYELELQAGADRVVVDGAVAATPDGTLSVRAADRFAQEDVRVVEWTGPAALAVTSPEPVDLAHATEASMGFAITYLVADMPAGRTHVSIRCGEGCEGRLDVSQGLAIAAGKGWREAMIPLACFAEAGADLSTVTHPFVLGTDAGLSLSVTDVRLRTVPETASCDF